MKHSLLFMAFVAAITGCSGGTPETAVPVPSSTSTPAVATAPPSQKPADKSASPQVPPPDGETSDAKPASSQPESQTLDIADLFAPPKAAPVPIKEPDRQPEKPMALPELPRQQAGPPPPMRLVGFSEMDELKALVSIDGKLNFLTLGQTAEGVELVGMQPPTVTLKHGESEIKIHLNEQPWTYVFDVNSSIGINMPLPNKPLPITIPGVKTPPAPSRGPANSPSVPDHRSPLNIQFPEASPPPIPPPLKKS